MTDRFIRVDSTKKGPDRFIRVDPLELNKTETGDSLDIDMTGEINNNLDQYQSPKPEVDVLTHVGSKITEGFTQVGVGIVGGTLSDAVEMGPLSWGEGALIASAPFTAIYKGVTKANLDVVKFLVGLVSDDAEAWIDKNISQTADMIDTAVKKSLFDATGISVPGATYEQVLKARDEVQKGIFETATEVNEAVRDFLPQNKELQDNFWATDLPAGIGSMLGFMTAAMIARGKGISPGLVASWMGSEAEGFSLAQEAYDMTGDLELARKVGNIGKVVGASEGLPIAALFNKLDGMTKPVVKEALGKGLKKYFQKFAQSTAGQYLIPASIQGMEESIQETSQTMAENMTAKELYDFNRGIMDGAWRGGAVGLITGTLMGMGATAYRHLKDGMTPQNKEVALKYINDQMEDLTKKAKNIDALNKVSNSIGLNFVMGKDGAIDSKGINPEHEIQGRAEVQKDFRTLLDQTVKELDKQPSANLLDAVYIMGEKLLDSYLNGVNKRSPQELEKLKTEKKEDKKYGAGIIDKDIKQNLNKKDLHDLTEDMYYRALAIANKTGIVQQLDIEEFKFLNPDVKKELIRDLTVATILGFDTAGYEILKHRYSSLGNIITKAIETSQGLQESDALQKVNKSVGNLVNASVGELARKVHNAKAKKIREDIKGSIADLKAPGVDVLEGAEIEEISRLEARAFHGGRPDITAFSSDWIGTGEGAQAFGWGLYFTERKGIAKGYADSLKEKLRRLKGKDEEVTDKLIKILEDYPAFKRILKITDLFRIEEMYETGPYVNKVGIGQLAEEAISPGIFLGSLYETLDMTWSHLAQRLSETLGRLSEATGEQGTPLETVVVEEGGGYSSEENQTFPPVPVEYNVEELKAEKAALEGALLDLDTLLNPEGFMGYMNQVLGKEMSKKETSDLRAAIYKVSLWRGKNQKLLDWYSVLPKEQLKKILSNIPGFKTFLAKEVARLYEQELQDLDKRLTQEQNLLGNDFSKAPSEVHLNPSASYIPNSGKFRFARLEKGWYPSQYRDYDSSLPGEDYPGWVLHQYSPSSDADASLGDDKIIKLSDAEAKTIYIEAQKDKEKEIRTAIAFYERAIEAHKKSPWTVEEKQYTGQAIYHRLKNFFESSREQERGNLWEGYTIDERSDKLASLALKKAGIDGIRYPTESLSGAGTEGSGAYNYVVFDEKDVEIEEYTKMESRAPISEAGVEGHATIREVYKGFPEFMKSKYGEEFDIGQATINDAFDYLKGIGYQVPQLRFFEKVLRNSVGHIPLLLKAREGSAAAYIFSVITPKEGVAYTANRRIEIDPTTVLPNPGVTAYTLLLHEVIHAWSSDVLELGRREGDPRYKEFHDKLYKTAQYIRGYISANKDLRDYIDALSEDEKLLLDRALTDVDELLSYTLSMEPILIKLLAKIPFTEVGEKQAGKKSVLRKIYEHLLNFLSKYFPDVNLPIDSVVTHIVDLMGSVETTLADYNIRHKTGNLNAIDLEFRKLRGFQDQDLTDPQDSDIVEQLDEGQEDDDTGEMESAREEQMVSSFAEFMADLLGLDIKALHLSLQQAKTGDLELIIREANDNSNGLVEKRLESLYEKRYKGRSNKDYGSFRKAMITRLLNRAMEISHKPTYTFVFNQTDNNFRLQRLGEVHKDANNNTSTTLRESIVLEEYVPAIAELLGLPEGVLGIAFLKNFEVQRKQRNNQRKKVSSTNLQRLTSWMLGEKEEIDKSDYLAKIINTTEDKVNKTRFVYLGSFADKNTLPVLTIKVDSDEDYKKFTEKIAPFRKLYKEISSTLEGDPIEDYFAELSAVMRALLEDMWYGADLTGKTPKSIVLGMDWNKVQKRGTKWVYNKKKIQEDWEHIKDLFADEDGNLIEDLHPGVYYDETARKILVRTAVFNTTDTTDLAEQTIEIDGKLHRVIDLIRNKLGDASKSRMDGASFYILGEFDDIYNRVYGILKDGALKNVVSSHYKQGAPLFIKHAMHGLHPRDPLAIWMRKNKIGVLSADEAAKISPVRSYNLGEISELVEDQSGMMTIPISDFHRYKEEQNLSFKAGKSRQAWMGSAFTSANPAVKAADKVGDFEDQLLTLMSKIVTIWGKENIGDAIDSQGYTNENAIADLRSIVLEPSSPKEVAIAKILSPILRLDDNEALDEYENVMHHTLFSNQINNKLRNRLADVLQMVLPGARVALAPSLGVLAKFSQVDPVTSLQNLRFHLLALPSSDKILHIAVPEKDIRETILDIRQLQRKETLYESKGNKAEGKAAQAELKAAKIKLGDLIQVRMDRDTPRRNFYKTYLSTGDINSLLDVTQPEIETYFESIKNKMLDEDGFVKDGYTIITADIARKYGIKPGDKVLAVVTPTDSALSVTAVTVAAVIPSWGVEKKMESSKAILNSEFIQSVVGKDFDIDTIALIPFDPEYWSADQFEKIVDTVKNTKAEYISRMVSTIQALFNEKRKKLLTLPDAINEDGSPIEVNSETVFSDRVRILFGQLMNGEIRGMAKKSFNILSDDFHYINDAYQTEIARVVQERLYHNILTSLGVEAKIKLPIFTAGGEQRAEVAFDMKVRHKSWFRTHLLHLIMTNHVVDFPNNTSMLHYNADMKKDITKQKLFQHMWGISDKNMEKIDDLHIESINEVISLMFGRGLQLARLRKEDGSKAATYFELLQGIEDQKMILDFLERGDTAPIVNLYQKTVTAQLESYERTPKITEADKKEARIESLKKIAIASAFLGGMKITESVYKYPMHKVISELPATRAPFYGLTQKEALETETQVGKSLANTFPGIAKLLEIIYGGIETGRNKELFTDQETKELYAPFTSARGEEVFADVDSIALNKLAEERDWQLYKAGNQKRKGKPLERARRIAIAIIHGLDEIASTGEKGDIRTWNEYARKKAFPRLFKKLVEKEFVTVIGDKRSIILKVDDGTDTKKEMSITVGSDGRLLISETGSTKGNYASNIHKLPVARRLLFEEGGVWESQSNRLKLSNFIKFPDNLSLDERKEVLSGWLREEFYNPANDEYTDFNIEDIAVFWLSFIGQVTNKGIRDRRAINLQVNRAQMDPNQPYTYQYNDMLLTLLSEHESVLKDSYLWHFNNIVDIMNRVSLKEAIGALQGDIAIGGEVLMETMERGESTLKRLVTDTFYENLKDFDGGFFKSNEYSNFKKVLRKEGYAGGLRELKNLFSKISTLRTLADLQINIGEVLYDIAHLSPAAFKAKYEKVNHPEIARTFSRYEAAAESTLERAITLDKSENLLAQLFYVHWKAEQRELKRSKLPNKWFAGKMIDEMYAPMKEKKTYVFADEDEVIGSMMTVGDVRPRAITPKKVATRYKILPTTNPMLVGEASLAIMKGERVDRVLNLHKEEMSITLEKIEDFVKILQSSEARNEYGGEEEQDNRMKALLNNIKDSKAPELLIRRLIFEMAEDMRTKLGVTVIEGSVPGTFLYKMKGDELIYDDVFDLLDKHFDKKSAEWKTYFLAALEYRKLYDHKARQVVISSLNYLNELYKAISQDITSYNEGMIYIARAIKVYTKYLKQLDERFGDYMPHRYPQHVYEEVWKSENYPVIKEGLVAQRKAHIKMRDNGIQGWDPKIANLTDDAIRELAEDRLDNQWVRLEESGVNTAFIPNFQKRRIEDPKVGYAKTGARVHTDYIFKLIDGAKRDLLLADWFLFHKLATSKGENLGVINSMRHWFASQLSNRILHSKKIKIESLKKGMNVSFLVKGEWIQDGEDDPIRTELRVSGIVRKVTNERIFLFVDPAKAIVEAQRRLKAYENIHASIANIPGGIPATAQQMKYINEMTNDGYLDALTGEEKADLTLTQANEIIYKALNAAIKNPDKLGSYKREQLYSRRLDGSKESEMVDRFIRYGAVEYLETKAREIRNIKLVQGYWDNPIMDKASWAALRATGATLGFTAKAYQRTMGLLVLGLLMAPKALFRNGLGLLVSGLSHMPIKGAKMFTKGISKYMGLKDKSIDKMSERERTIFNTLASLSLARTTSVIKLTLGSLNINREDILIHKKWYQKVAAAYKLFNEATGYGSFIKELRDLNKEYRRKPTLETKIKIRKLKHQWNKKVTKIFEDDVKFSATDVDSVLKKLEEVDPSKITLNEAIELGITKKKSLLAFGKLLYDMVYEGPLGITTQALAEYGRIPTFYMYYELAKQHGHAIDVDDGIQYAINAVQGFNALYSPQNKQRDSNTRLGRAYLQFVQYQLNAIMSNIKLVQDTIVQSIGQVGPGKLRGLQLLLKKDLTSVSELSKKLEDQGYATKSDVNIVRAVFVRWMANAIAWQVGVSGTIMGLQYAVDPFVGVVLGGMEFLADASAYLFGGDDDDDEEMLKRDIVEAVYETVFILGTPWKQGVQVALRPDQSSIIDALVQGRIASQFGTLERAINTANIAFGQEEEMSRDEVKKNLIDPVWAIDNFITGMGLVGPRRYLPEETDWTRNSYFLGEEDLTFPPHEGIFDEDSPWLNAVQRWRTGVTQPHKSLLPLGHKIFKND